MRGRRERHRGRRARARLTSRRHVAIRSSAARRGRPRLRLPQRLPRRGELHRHRGVDPRAVAAAAVVWAAFFNFVACALRAPRWPRPIGKGIVDAGVGDDAVVLAALMGAIVWNLLTWWCGLPSSSSHALIGGLIGAAMPSRHRVAALRRASCKTAAFIVLSPLIGMVLGGDDHADVSLVCSPRRPAKVDRSSGGCSWSRRRSTARPRRERRAEDDGHHLAAAVREPASRPRIPLPIWVVLLCHAAIGLGTLFGGWRIVKTMGQTITKLQPVGGFCAETGGRDHPRPGSTSASRSRPRTPSPAPSSASARPAAPGGPVGGGGTSSGRGSSRFRRRRWSRRSAWWIGWPGAALGACTRAVRRRSVVAVHAAAGATATRWTGANGVSRRLLDTFDAALERTTRGGEAAGYV